MDRTREEDLRGLFDAGSAVQLDPLVPAQSLAAGYTPIYLLRGDPRSKTALIGDDGLHVVVIDDFSEQWPEADPEVLQFYKVGELLAACSLDDLLNDVSSVRRTSSQFRWLYAETLKFSAARTHL